MLNFRTPSAVGSPCCHSRAGELRVHTGKHGSDDFWDAGGPLPICIGPLEQSNVTTT